ncbi:cellulose binding domain-containing protein [Actinocrinis puniceicyclus]|uniref:Cellulose binding domain-containing protein n=1 Tax=Actinocrinis puniceicyclus TaxID=977794 RepID=A0A8J8BBI3_9ACTN|nr:cellulose binding domain-containing protein [Actinocrinis puniceicyclus]MBS2963158.1 cellulose binding domain-containing protein [Actinocrinis puniceicyclus]
MGIRNRRWSSGAAALALTAGATLAAVTVGAASAPADTGAACSAAYSIGWQTPSDSPPDFGVTVTVTNNSTYPISTWAVSWNFTAGQAIIAGSPYSATVVQNGTTVTATPGGSYNATLAPGASTTWGFHATFNGTGNPVPAVTCSGPSQGSSSAVLSGSLTPLGVNTASWDTNFVDPAISTDLNAAHTGLIRYPGGSWADEYLWQTNTAKGQTQPVDFAQYSSQVDSISGGQKFVTVNYGSDTAASAGAWAKQAATTPGQNVALWEIANENYGSWETDNHTGAHTAASYASNGLAYMQAIKAADPKAQICYDYGMDGGLAPGSGVDNWQSWNSTILQADAADIDCADVHWYPINGVPTESVQSIMELVDNIPAAAAEVKSTLSAYDPKAYFVVGETNMSQTANEWNEEPVGALFAAANALEWLSFGAQSVDWWDVHNYGSQTADFGMFSSATTGEPAMDTPYAPYYGYQLASKLAVSGAKVSTLNVATPNIYGYSSSRPGGSYAVLLANADPSNAYTVSTSSLGITSLSETEYAYSAAKPTIATSTFSGTSLTIPAESVVVLTDGSGSSPSASPSASPSHSSSPSASPSASPSSSPSSSPSASASGGSGGCTATWSVTNSWGGGFQLGFTVTASGTKAVSGWNVGYSWPGSQTVSQIWNATETQSGAAVTATNLSYNGALSPGGSTTFGLIGTGSTPSTLPNLSCTAH